MPNLIADSGVLWAPSALILTLTVLLSIDCVVIWLGYRIGKSRGQPIPAVILAVLLGPLGLLVACFLPQIAMGESPQRQRIYPANKSSGQKVPQGFAGTSWLDAMAPEEEKLDKAKDWLDANRQ